MTAGERENTATAAAYAAGLKAAFSGDHPSPPYDETAAAAYMAGYDDVAYDPVAEAARAYEHARRALQEAAVTEACRIAPDTVAELLWAPDLSDPEFAFRFAGARTRDGTPVRLPADVFDRYTQLAPHFQGADRGHLSILFTSNGLGAITLRTV